MAHASVLLHESIDGLDIRDGDVFLDCTLGGGGHSAEVCRRSGGTVTLVGLDVDSEAIARSTDRLRECGCAFRAALGSFRDLDRALQSLGIERVDKVLFDFGLSSDQFESSGRGFTFQKDEPLLMTMKKDIGPDDLTAREVVNVWDEENIAAVLRGYGDERFANRIARRIGAARAEHGIETTGDLVKVIQDAVPAAYRHGRIHPATRTFQALRIAVNDELTAIKEGLAKAFEILTPGGRIAAISFHSGEDRIVKNAFREWAKAGRAILHTKKPITPSEQEIEENPRSRSAKLRVIEKVG